MRTSFGRRVVGLLSGRKKSFRQSPHEQLWTVYGTQLSADTRRIHLAFYAFETKNLPSRKCFMSSLDCKHD